MNIVVLDGFTLNPGDLRWDALTSLGDCTIHDRTPDPEIISWYTGHTCTMGKHRIYSKSNDHIIDADRAETLAELLGVEMDEPFAVRSNVR